MALHGIKPVRSASCKGANTTIGTDNNPTRRKWPLGGLTVMRWNCLYGAPVSTCPTMMIDEVTWSEVAMHVPKKSSVYQVRVH